MKNCWFCYSGSGDNEYHSKCSKKFFGTEKAPALELNDSLLKKIAGENINQRIAITGVQPKLSVTFEKAEQGDRLTIIGLWGEFILKPQHKGFSSMPETEDLTMHLASLFKIPVCNHTLLKTTTGEFEVLPKIRATVVRN
jgi:serine/threonine-protein kinase HipA